MADSPVQITDPRVEEYILDMAKLGGAHSMPEGLPEVLQVMEEYAEGLSFPIVGPMLGRVLYMLTGLVGAKRIYDAGCGFGYSAAWMAAGAGAGATVTCVDLSEENVRLARENHRRAGLKASFDYRYGDAVQTLEQEVGPYDIVFNDVDKQHYPRIGELAAARLRPGGIYIADNSLWYGKVCSAATTRDAWTAAVDRHNQWFFSNASFFTTLIDQRDGLLIAVKQRA